MVGSDPESGSHVKVCDVRVLDPDAVIPDQGLFQGYKSTPEPPGPLSSSKNKLGSRGKFLQVKSAFYLGVT